MGMVLSINQKHSVILHLPIRHMLHRQNVNQIFPAQPYWILFDKLQSQNGAERVHEHLPSDRHPNQTPIR